MIAGNKGDELEKKVESLQKNISDLPKDWFTKSREEMLRYEEEHKNHYGVRYYLRRVEYLELWRHDHLNPTEVLIYVAIFGVVFAVFVPVIFKKLRYNQESYVEIKE